MNTKWQVLFSIAVIVYLSRPSESVSHCVSLCSFVKLEVYFNILFSFNKSAMAQLMLLALEQFLLNMTCSF